MKVWIMRGIPGCGKDTFIERELKQYDPIVICADDEHTFNGKYEYRKERAEAAHNACLQTFVSLTIGRATTSLVINNTNIRMFEIAPYYRLAQAFGYEVQIFQFLCPPELGFRRNVHNVPRETIEMMARSMDPLPSFWNVTYIVSKVDEIPPLDI